MNYIRHITFSLIILFIFLVIGCNDNTKTAVEKNLDHNAIIENTAFQNLLLSKKIMMVAPASGTEPDNIERIKGLTNHHLGIPDNIIQKSKYNRYHANTDKIRFELLKKAILDDATDIIWALRGGYGSARLLEQLKNITPIPNEKIFIGYSDNTALHLFFTQEWNWRTIHGAMLLELLNSKKDPSNFEKLLDLLLGKTKILTLDNLYPLNQSARDATLITGKLTGGNLTIVQNSLGTFWQIKTAGKILFLEDEMEPSYKVDRLLTQLKQAGVLKEVKAIIFGEFNGSDEALLDTLKRFSNEESIPIFKTNQFGHGPVNYPLLYNTDSTIKKSVKPYNFTLEMKNN